MADKNDYLPWWKILLIILVVALISSAAIVWLYEILDIRP